MTIKQKVFIAAFLMGITFVSTAAAMAFTTPGISETIFMRVKTVLNPQLYTASVWDTVTFK